MLTFQSPTIHRVVYFYPGPLGLETLYQWGEVQYSIMNQQDSTFRFFPSPSSRRGVPLTCLYSVVFCLSGPDVNDRRALPGLHYAFSCHCRIVSLCWLMICHTWGQKEEGVALLLCVLLRSGGVWGVCKPFGLFSCLSTLRMLGVSSNRVHKLSNPTLACCCCCSITGPM